MASPVSIGKETLIYAVYYAPRGRVRLYALGKELAQRHLYPSDLLIGIIGAEGAGKSTLIRGLFPGLELTNDDEGINLRPTPIFGFAEDDAFSGHTFHIDARFEGAFHQPWEIADAVRKAVEHGRRVIVEHFDLLYEHLGFNAQLIFGIGQEVIVTRPSVFGPLPGAVRDIVFKTVKYRLMAHSAEDITSMILARDYNYTIPAVHSDVKHGFVMGFAQKPAIDLEKLEADVKAIIAANVPIGLADENHLRIGEETIPCTGVRTHVKFSGQIENFRLIKEFRYNPIDREYLLIGIVGIEQEAGFEEILPVVA
ncbi:MAG: lantibiotic ABC transporter [Lentisphaerae bacterium RIFOXYB12_FULL_65_16]|nr:MAG: lantibiotic ABC transporter [Lentisphaerae bacterium RIFOXYA12_64_32]OGV86436.1 MAG: lantibiotic ABC transporter [Lentisphaerae bacterium RIFOXYB12_FULL_65_16]